MFVEEMSHIAEILIKKDTRLYRQNTLYGVAPTLRAKLATWRLNNQISLLMKNAGKMKQAKEAITKKHA